jgi:hypothetical protein
MSCCLTQHEVGDHRPVDCLGLFRITLTLCGHLFQTLFPSYRVVYFPDRNFEERKEDFCSTPKMLLHRIPVEVWAIVFGYAASTRQEVDPVPRWWPFAQQPQPADRPTTHMRLLCRDVTDGLDECIRVGLEEGMKRDGGLRLDQPTSSLQAQKRELLALSRSPEEFLKSIMRLEGRFLSPVAAGICIWKENHVPKQVVETDTSKFGCEAVQNFLDKLRSLSVITGV